MPVLPTVKGNWKNDLAFRLRNPSGKRSPDFNALIAKVLNHPQAVLTEDEVNDFVLECMCQEEDDLLREILEQEPLQTLHIARHVEEGAWQTLLKAMPDPCSVRQLILSGQKFGRASASSLFELMRRMPELHILYFHSCNVAFSAQLELPCPRLLKLQIVRVEQTQTPYAMLRPILEVSQVSTVHLDSNLGMDDETHLFLAMTLCNHAATLQELTLRGLQGGKNLDQYFPLMQRATKLARLDLSLNDLSPLDCEDLLNALEGKSTLTSLSLARCWRRMGDKSDWKALAMLIKLPSLVSLDLSRNKFSSSTAPMLMAIPGHPSLQHLNLSGSTMTDKLITIALPAILENNKTLVSLQLPPFDDSDFGPLVEAMEQNHVLRSLPIADIERWCSTMSAEESHRLFPNYLALVGQVALNRRAWDEKRLALMEGGMKVVLGGMGRADSGSVFEEIARYAAGHVAIEGTGNEAMALTLLNKKANEEGQAALKRLQGKK
jgi:hypothetical protein